MKEIPIWWMKNKNPKSDERQEPVQPLDKNLVVVSTVWHISISILIVTSFLLPWYDNINYFGTFFLIFPQIEWWHIETSIVLFAFFIILISLLLISGIYHVRASLSNDVISTRKRFDRGLRAFFWSYLCNLALFMSYLSLSFSIHFGGLGFLLYLNLFIFCGFLLVIEGIAYLWAKHEKVL